MVKKETWQTHSCNATYPIPIESAQTLEFFTLIWYYSWYKTIIHFIKLIELMIKLVNQILLLFYYLHIFSEPL